MAATGTSSLGDGLVSVAFPLLAVTLTRDPLLIAGVAIAGRLPWLLISLPAGALADRMDRRRLVAVVETTRAIVLLGLGVTIAFGQATLVMLYGAAFVVGALETAFAAATRAIIPSLVRDAQVPRANGYLLAAETTAEQFAGPGVGGLLFAWAPAVPFLADAASFAGSAALLTRALPGSAIQSDSSSTTLMEDVRASLRWLRGQPALRVLALIVSTFAFCQAMVLSVLVLYGLRVLGLSKTGYGLFLSVAAIGDVLGSILAHRIHASIGAARTVAAAGIAAACGYLMLASTTTIAIGALGCTLEAFAVALGNVATLSLRHKLIPTELFGRVNNAFRTCVFGVVVVGALAGGVLTTRIGIRSTFLLAGGVQLLLTALLTQRLAAEIVRSPARRS
ncbi:MAG: MFS transporter [Actinomycetota bacterium]|nr:MFS transporter [Actinomycetota bacterium]